MRIRLKARVTIRVGARVRIGMVSGAQFIECTEQFLECTTQFISSTNSQNESNMIT